MSASDVYGAKRMEREMTVKKQQTCHNTSIERREQAPVLFASFCYCIALCSAGWSQEYLEPIPPPAKQPPIAPSLILSSDGLVLSEYRLSDWEDPTDPDRGGTITYDVEVANKPCFVTQLVSVRSV